MNWAVLRSSEQNLARIRADSFWPVPPVLVLKSSLELVDSNIWYSTRKVTNNTPSQSIRLQGHLTTLVKGNLPTECKSTMFNDPTKRRAHRRTWEITGAQLLNPTSLPAKLGAIVLLLRCNRGTTGAASLVPQSTAFRADGISSWRPNQEYDERSAQSTPSLAMKSRQAKLQQTPSCVNPKPTPTTGGFAIGPFVHSSEIQSQVHYLLQHARIMPVSRFHATSSLVPTPHTAEVSLQCERLLSHSLPTLLMWPATEKLVLKFLRISATWIEPHSHQHIIFYISL